MAIRRTIRHIFFLVLVFCAPVVQAQVNSGRTAINLLAVRNPGVAVAVSPGNVNFALVNNGTSTGNTPVTITTTWDVQPSVANIRLYAYFTSSAAALTSGGGNNIAASRVSGSVNGGAFTAFTGNSPYAAGSSLLVFTLPIIGNNRRGTRNDTLNLRIGLAGLALPAGTYTGTLFIQAQAL